MIAACRKTGSCWSNSTRPSVSCCAPASRKQRSFRRDAYAALRRHQTNGSDTPAAAVVSGLPLFTKPLKTRARLLRDAFGILRSGAPFIQFTYAVVPPIPKMLAGGKVEASDRIWLNLPPARVWVYRKN